MKHSLGRARLLFEPPFQYPLGGLGIAAALHQHVENETILIDSLPEPVFLSADHNHNFMEVPFVAKPTGGSPADFAGKVPTEFLCPQTHCLMRDNDPTCRQQILDHPQTEREPKIEPDDVADHFSWETVAAIKEIARALVHATKSQRLIADKVNVTMPFRPICLHPSIPNAMRGYVR
ncbi:hypothetical protein A6U89_28575 [Agrobacterium sp. B133/95]|nr:hypothetical protein A6U88_28995 [Agrobacterium sp. B131/95]OCJ28563.1 hypothetical protein A6U89_28575 [Agrobacterium sp. B133/95]